MSTSAPPAGLVVIGGGPAGHAAAAGYRDAGGNGRVLIISADEAPPYQRPPLSKDFLRGETGERELPLESPSFYRDNGIDLWLSENAHRLDLVGRTVTTGSRSVVGYRTCVLAMGCRPADLPVPGADHPDVRRLRSVADGRLLRSAATAARSSVVIGSGFIGCEVAASLSARGLAVTMLSTEELPQLSRLGRAAAERIAGWLSGAGVRLVGRAEVTEIRDGRDVLTDSGVFQADLLLAATGVVPNSELAQRAGFELVDGRVAVDERMATAVPGVYAAGDLVTARNATAGRGLQVEHWGEALRMGEIAGRNAAGSDETWDDVPGFWSTIGDRTLKYASWGDGFDRDELVAHPDGGFTVRYRAAGRTVGVLTHRADDDYESGRQLIAEQARSAVR